MTRAVRIIRHHRTHRVRCRAMRRFVKARRRRRIRRFITIPITTPIRRRRPRTTTSTIATTTITVRGLTTVLALVMAEALRRPKTHRRPAVWPVSRHVKRRRHVGKPGTRLATRRMTRTITGPAVATLASQSVRRPIRRSPAIRLGRPVASQASRPATMTALLPVGSPASRPAILWTMAARPAGSSASRSVNRHQATVTRQRPEGRRVASPVSPPALAAISAPVVAWISHRARRAEGRASPPVQRTVARRAILRARVHAGARASPHAITVRRAAGDRVPLRRRVPAIRSGAWRFIRPF